MKMQQEFGLSSHVVQKRIAYFEAQSCDCGIKDGFYNSCSRCLVLDDLYAELEYPFFQENDGSEGEQCFTHHLEEEDIKEYLKNGYYEHEKYPFRESMKPRRV